MIKFEDINGNDYTLNEEVIQGVREKKVFGSNRKAYFLVDEEGFEIEISKSCYDDFIEAEYKAL